MFNKLSGIVTPVIFADFKLKKYSNLCAVYNRQNEKYIDLKRIVQKYIYFRRLEQSI